ncbi:MAG: hypothetical protein NTU53_00505 [Planctomycetota bacterium]|nr:hypothetical protein [Planctomycetota bacterium]
MELHGYLDHGYRVLGHPDKTKTTPEIVEHAEHVDLPGLDREKVIALKLDGNKEAELSGRRLRMASELVFQSWWQALAAVPSNRQELDWWAGVNQGGDSSNWLALWGLVR